MKQFFAKLGAGRKVGGLVLLGLVGIMCTNMGTGVDKGRSILIEPHFALKVGYPSFAATIIDDGGVSIPADQICFYDQNRNECRSGDKHWGVDSFFVWIPSNVPGRGSETSGPLSLKQIENIEVLNVAIPSTFLPIRVYIKGVDKPQDYLVSFDLRFGYRANGKVALTCPLARIKKIGEIQQINEMGNSEEDMK